MADKNILLSICIPTCNRSAVLRETLESIVAEEAFLDSNEVEVVISDNASTDDTPVVGRAFSERFPGKITYVRQPSNTGGANFHHVLMLGNGLYRKLHNDTLLVRQGALRRFLDMLKDVADQRPVIALTNGNRIKEGSQAYEVCHKLDDLVGNVSYFMTWIGGMGLWREDIELAQSFLDDSSQLAQVDIQCRLVASGRPALAIYTPYFISKQDHRGRFNWTKVFGKNYLSILKKYVASSHLSVPVYEQAKQIVLMRHILPNYFNTKNVYNKLGFFANLADYLDDEYFYQAIADRLPLLWRLSNPHNQIEFGHVSSPYVLARVIARIKSRGVLNVRGPLRSKASLDIGRFVTLGEGVFFVLGENAPAGGSFSNYWTGAHSEETGSITIGDDVWIGSGAQIMSGVTIGQGAVVAAGSVVVDNVPPYSHVSGNPACVVSYRFAPEVIEKLCAFDFSTLTDQTINRVGAGFLAPIDADNVDAFLHLLKVAGMPDDAPEQADASALAAVQRVPAVLLLDEAGVPAEVEAGLAALASSDCRELPVIVLTTQTDALPEWTDSLRYISTSADEFADSISQLRALPDFDWVKIVAAGQ